MITKKQMANAEEINRLSNLLGHLPYNRNGQTPNGTLNLSIPCAWLVVAGIVTGVDKNTNDGINDNAVEDVKRLVREAVAFQTEAHGRGWWNETAELVGL